MATKGLHWRLSRTLALQVIFISIATVLGVLVARTVLEDVLIRRALTDESEYFWERRAANDSFALPDTRNMRGYIGAVPTGIASLENGFHNLQQTESQLVFVSERSGERLFLVYDGRRVNELAIYFGLAPLVLVLLVLYLSSWLGFRASRRAISPVIALANEVQALDPERPDPLAFDIEKLGASSDDEVAVLAEALGRFATRLNEFVERERHFTRDASHELRSPLTVIAMAAELLREDPGLGERGHRSLDRIARAVEDMQELIGAFLLLARENQSGLANDNVALNALVADELERARLLAGDKPIEAELREHCRLFIDAPEKVLSVMIGNLIRNAFSYTDEGRVSVTISPQAIEIADTGIGMSADQLRDMYRPFVRGESGRRGGYGVGLTIVRRLSDRFGWPVSVESETGVGTRVTIAFPEARIKPAQAMGGAAVATEN